MHDALSSWLVAIYRLDHDFVQVLSQVSSLHPQVESQDLESTSLMTVAALLLFIFFAR